MKKTHKSPGKKSGCVLVMTDNDHVVSLDIVVGKPCVLSVMPFLELGRYCRFLTGLGQYQYSQQFGKSGKTLAFYSLTTLCPVMIGG